MAVQLVEEDVLAALQNKLGTKDFVVDSWKQISAMEDGRLGFLGDHFKIEAFVRHPASAPKAELQSMFVKSLPRNPRARATVVDAGVFKKEALFYKLVSKDIAEAAAREREPGFQPFVYPPCYLIKDDCLLLEDLSPFQFKGTEARKPLPIEHARLVVRALGEMHGGSLLLEERRGRTILEQFPDLDYETFFMLEPGHPNMTWHNASIKLCHDIIPHLDKYKDDPATVERIRAAMPDLIKQVFRVMGPWPGVRNVVNHGDLWVNNFMFRYDKSGRPVEVAFVDFQLARYTPPASDLLFFITFCTDRALQEKHLGELTRLHWDSIADTLRRGGCDPDKVLPWSEFEEVAKKMWKYGLILMSIEYPFALAPPSLMDPLLEDPEKFYHHCHVDRSEPLIKVYHEDAIFHSRYNEIMERLIDGYILNKP